MHNTAAILQFLLLHIIFTLEGVSFTHNSFFLILGYSFVSKPLIQRSPDLTPQPPENNGNVAPPAESNRNVAPPVESNRNGTAPAESNRNVVKVSTKPDRPTKSQVLRIRKRVSQ